jgi:hypothetical protein
MHLNLKIKHSHAKIKLNPNPHGWWSKKAIFLQNRNRPGWLKQTIF